MRFGDLKNDFMTAARSMLESSTCTKRLSDLQESAARCLNYAEFAKTTGIKYANAICSELGVKAESSVKIGPPKDLTRLVEKALSRYNGRIEDVSDLCRLRVELDTASQVLALRKLLNPRHVDASGKATDFHANDFNNGWAKKGITLVEAEDSFAVPTSTGYMALNNKYRVDLGKGRTQMIEIQFVLKDMQPAYDQTHVYLENKRAIEDERQSAGLPLSPADQALIRSHQDAARRIHNAASAGLGLHVLRAKPSGHAGLKLVG